MLLSFDFIAINFFLSFVSSASHKRVCFLLNVSEKMVKTTIFGSLIVKDENFVIKFDNSTSTFIEGYFYVFHLKKL